ncbi:hypothetical protein D9758_014994 [Tetrapyrgos nigripes]|uniref:Uncharacterized protein n=1 Tax=Tetrapyrgos nigripes TaxID=182062 RepID=A0A8H5FKJ1_9AGAR|nr:hypothetical protein D9758_014994 [Tetrapyrgos nigripes]
MLQDPKILAQIHLPAVKVGGRRLSTSSKAKTHASTTSEVAPEVPTEAEEPTDYPRPVAGEQHHDAPHHNEEEKKDKKPFFDSFAHKKTEENKPTRDFQAAGKGFGAGGRIAQPAGKVLGA